MGAVEETGAREARLNEFEQCEGRCAILRIEGAQNRVHLRIPATIRETEQETAEQGQVLVWLDVSGGICLVNRCFRGYVQEDQNEG